MPTTAARPPAEAMPADTACLLATPAARSLVASLRSEHGPLMFHQAAGDGAAGLPLCFACGDFPLFDLDVLLGDVDGAPFYVCRRRLRGLAQRRLQLDAEPGRAGVFSLERPTGLRFVTRLLTAAGDQRLRSRR